MSFFLYIYFLKSHSAALEIKSYILFFYTEVCAPHPPADDDTVNRGIGVKDEWQTAEILRREER